MTEPTPLTGNVELLARRCAICTAYASERGARIRAEIRRTTPYAQRTDRWLTFMTGVHQRHLDQARGNIRALGRVTALMSAIHQPEETR